MSLLINEGMSWESGMWGDTCIHGIFSASLISLSARSSMDQSEYDASMDWSEYKEYKY